MITIDQHDDLIHVAVFGEFTLSDFKEFEDLAVFTSHDHPTLKLHLDLREMSGATVDMVWEEFRFSREHANDFSRIGIVTDSEWVTWSAWLQRLFVTAQIMVNHDSEDVGAWLADTDTESDAETAPA
jgi:hypothetical protein